MRLLPLITLAAFVATPALAQQRTGRPDGWRTRFDRPAPDSTLFFVTMTPGWHVTTGPAGILWRPTESVRGAWHAEMEVYLFPPGRRNEAFGLFFGGRDLDGAGQAYTYFLIRKTGEFLIKAREGDATSTIVGWSANPAIHPHPGDSSNVKNVLAVDVSADSVAFSVNGQRVHAMARAGLVTDGLVGMRINHGLNLHVSRFEVTQR